MTSVQVDVRGDDDHIYDDEDAALISASAPSDYSSIEGNPPPPSRLPLPRGNRLHSGNGSSGGGSGRRRHRRRHDDVAPTPAISSSSLSSTSLSSLSTPSSNFRVYKRRWLILIAASVLNLTNAFNWLTFAPVATESAEYFNVTPETVDWFGQAFFISGIPFSIFFWALDVWGLRPCLILACWFNGIGAGLRILATLDVFKDMTTASLNAPFVVALLGQIVASIGQPIAVASGTKIAATWFADNQRVAANAVISLSNAAGMMVANIAIPYIVTSTREISDLLIYAFVPSACLVLFTTFAVWSSFPPTPPSASASIPPPPFLEGAKKLFRSKAFWLLLQAGGCGIGIFSSLLTLLQQVLCVKGYSAEFSGACGAGAIAMGLLVSIVIGIVVDKRAKLKAKMEEIVKVLMHLTVLGLIAFTIAATFTSQPALVLVSLLLFGGCGCAAYPLILELAVETHYPAPEATASGVVFLFGQVVGAVSLILAPLLSRPASAADLSISTCAVDGTPSAAASSSPDMTWSNILLCAILTTAVCLFTLGFTADYVRTKVEKREAASKILNFCRGGSLGGGGGRIGVVGGGRNGVVGGGRNGGVAGSSSLISASLERVDKASSGRRPKSSGGGGVGSRGGGSGGSGVDGDSGMGASAVGTQFPAIVSCNSSGDGNLLRSPRTNEHANA